MVHRFVWAAGFALIVLAPIATSRAAPQAIPEDFVIKLERTACYGRCPVYVVSIDAMGNVTLRGNQVCKGGRTADGPRPGCPGGGSRRNG